MATDTTTVQITMPQMGESVTEGTVLEWHKQVGDPVTADEIVVEVSTDKVDAEVSAPVAGVLTKIVAESDETVAAGAVLGEIEATSNGAGNGAAQAPPAPPETPQAAAPGPAQLVDVTLPAMGDSVAEGTVLAWRKQVGDAVAAEETVVEISTDKVDAEVPAPVSGEIAEILVQADEAVSVGTVLARIAQAGPGGAPQRPEAGAPSAGAEAESSLEGGGGAVADGNGAHGVTPVAGRIASANGLDLSQIEGSGPRGRVTKMDVLEAIEDNGASAATPASAAPTAPSAVAGAPRPIRGPAATLARFMNASLAVPTATSFRTIAVDVLDERRRALKASGRRLSFTHLIAWALVRAAQEMPAMAVVYTEVEGKPYALDPDAVNLGLAVDVERGEGQRFLVTPVLQRADALDFAGFVARYDELVAGARDNGLPPDAYAGANMSLTNPGGIGTVASVPRLMPGQGTIVATGAIGYPPGFGQVDPEKLAELGVAKVMTLSSTYDHRVIQGAQSGAFLRRIEELLRSDDFYETIFAGGAATGEVAEAAAVSAPAPATAADPVPADVEPRVRERLPADATAHPYEELLQAVQAATSVVKAHRMHGHLAARLDPLGHVPPGDPALDPATVSLTPSLMKAIPASILRVAVKGENFADVLPRLRETYCGTMAYEIEHIASHEKRVWLRQAIESGAYRKPPPAQQKRRLLDRLSRVEALESYLHKTFLGRKQFSIEGLDTLVPVLDEAIELASLGGARQTVIGMAHRGRLNVLAHVVGHPYERILVEFEAEKNLEAGAALPTGGTGDVKYHHGAAGTYSTDEGKSVNVILSANPSHLEVIDPVISGRARADQTSRNGRELHHDPTVVLPVQIHGDAAFPGQGVVAETLNLQALDGYEVGGTLHVITNNQLGFTTDPRDARSTRYASDLAKGFDVPIIHVNADDVEGCVAAVRLAIAFRERFGRDALIDLIGYRRFGHNETDEPAYTQPKMYEAIKRHPPVRELYAEQLIAEGVVNRDEADELAARAYARIAEAHEELKASMAKRQERESREIDRSASPEPRTAVPLDTLRSLNEQLLRVPEGFEVHRKLRPQLERRREALGEERSIDWAQAEALAWASLLSEGVPVRLTGQDSERGTFSHRHLVLHDARTGECHTPIKSLASAEAPFELHNSPLSEVACLGFEYGYSVQAPEALVLWEAQFGDFVNGGQVIVDQFLVSGLAKWGQTSRLTLLLPHGYEGSGPEHSSGRVERFLQLAAEGNIRVANCTTPAQYFHLLRRQGLLDKRRPLIVMTPKSLLRHPAATSQVGELADGEFHAVLDDPTLPGDREQVKRLVLCTGKVYYDIATHEAREQAKDVAVARVELLYPFAEAELVRVMESYPALETVVWVQEEPRNMGARAIMEPRIASVVPSGVRYEYEGRTFRASPGEGYPAAHTTEQSRIVREALDMPAAGDEEFEQTTETDPGA